MISNERQKRTVHKHSEASMQPEANGATAPPELGKVTFPNRAETTFLRKWCESASMITSRLFDFLKPFFD